MSELAVSPVVNSARVEYPRCCLPVESPEVSGKLKITHQAAELDQQTLGF